MVAGNGNFIGMFGSRLPIDGCVVLLCTAGEAELSTDTNRRTIKKGQVAIFFFDMFIVPLCSSPDFSFSFLSVDFSCATVFFHNITSTCFWNLVYENPLLHPDKTTETFVDLWMKHVLWAHSHFTDKLRDSVLANEADTFFKVMTDYAERQSQSSDDGISRGRAWTITVEFTALLHRHCARHHDVAFYADRLNITSDYLNTISRRNLGDTAKAYISMRLILLVKSLLATTDLSVKIIANRLHYDDPSYMCRIFRRHTGMSPIEYRNHARHSPVSYSNSL